MNFLVAASRGGGLAKKIQGYEVIDAVFPGAKLEYLTEKAVKMIPPPQPHGETPHIYIMAGLTDITTLHKTSTNHNKYKEVTLDGNPAEIISRVCSEIDKCARAIADAGATPCFCTITYSYIEKYNHHLLKEHMTNTLLHQDKYKDMQANLIPVIDEINHHITNINHSYNMSTPFCHTAIRKKHGTKPRHYYKYDHKMLKDGVHGEYITRVKWAKAIQGAMENNRGDVENRSPKRSWRREHRN